MHLSGRFLVLFTIFGLASCSSTPRAFTPLMATPPGDQTAFEQAFAQCSADVSAGRRESFRDGRGGSAAGGLAIGGAAALATGASAASGAGMLAGAAAGAGLAVGLVVFAPLAIFGVSRMQRAAKEREIQTAMALCLGEEGYVVDRWQSLSRGATGMASPIRPAPSGSASDQ